MPPRGDGKRQRVSIEEIGDLPPELTLARLPTGRHGLSRDFVARNHQLRLAAAMMQGLPIRGYAETTIADLTKEAGVSRAAFYEQFASKEECFLFAYDLAGDWLDRKVKRAVDPEAPWPERVGAGLREVLHLLAENPVPARLLTVEASRVGEAVRERQRACMAHFAAALRAGRPDRPPLPDELEELLLGGVLAFVARYVEGDRAAQLPEASEQLLEYLLIPYLGHQEAERVAACAA